jgi:ATP-binding cassette subfamily B protein
VKNVSPFLKQEESFKITRDFEAIAGLPRVIRLVWSTDARLTTAMALVSILRGFTPAVSFGITKQLIDSVVNVIKTHHISMVLWYVGAQLVVNVLDRLLGTLSKIVQQLLQDRVSTRVQLLILEKANTLDLAVPIPSFIASSRYGWMGYIRMRRESPERRKMYYFNRLMTDDDYNKEIKLFNLGNFFIERYQHLADTFYEENKRILVRRNLTGFYWMALSLVANASIYIYVALQAVMGRITLGGLTLYTQTAQQVGQSFQALLDGLSNTYENNLFVSTLFEFLEYKAVITSPEKPQPLVHTLEGKGLVIEFRNVSFTYPDKDPATQATLKNVSFTIQAGEAIALVGRNGAGKTTIVKLLTRLYDPDEGEILIGGRNIKEYDLKALREEIGVIFQDYVAYYLNVRENIGVGRVNDIDNLELVNSAAQKSGADVIVEELADGYETMLGRWWKDATQLSGGQWQKVALARAFIRDARILILDEPTSSLDARAAYEVFAKFRELTEGKTAIFISHRFSTVRLADRIFVLENGAILEDGSHDEWMMVNGRYAELFNLQAEA